MHIASAFLCPPLPAPPSRMARHRTHIGAHRTTRVAPRRSPDPPMPAAVVAARNCCTEGGGGGGFGGGGGGGGFGGGQASPAPFGGQAGGFSTPQAGGGGFGAPAAAASAGGKVVLIVFRNGGPQNTELQVLMQQTDQGKRWLHAAAKPIGLLVWPRGPMPPTVVLAPRF